MMKAQRPVLRLVQKIFSLTLVSIFVTWVVCHGRNVSKVITGNTVILDNNEIVRLQGILIPRECDEEFAAQSRTFLEVLLTNIQVTLVADSRGPHDDTLVGYLHELIDPLTLDSISINHKLILSGFARADTSNDFDRREVFEEATYRSRENYSGLWITSAFSEAEPCPKRDSEINDSQSSKGSNKHDYKTREFLYVKCSHDFSDYHRISFVVTLAGDTLELREDVRQINVDSVLWEVHGTNLIVNPLAVHISQLPGIWIDYQFFENEVSAVTSFSSYVSSLQVPLLNDTLGDTIAVVNLGDKLEVFADLQNWSRVVATFYDHTSGTIRTDSGLIESASTSRNYTRSVYESKQWVGVDIANIRSGPSKDYDLIGQLSYGDSVRIIKVIGEWRNVRTARSERSKLVVEPSGEWMHTSLLQSAKPTVRSSDNSNSQSYSDRVETNKNGKTQLPVDALVSARVSFAKSFEKEMSTDGYDAFQVRVRCSGDSKTVLEISLPYFTRDVAQEFIKEYSERNFRKWGFNFVNFYDANGLVLSVVL